MRKECESKIAKFNAKLVGDLRGNKIITFEQNKLHTISFL